MTESTEMNLLKEELEFLGAEAIRNPAQTMLFYQARYYGWQTLQWAVLGKRMWVRRSKGSEAWHQWKLSTHYLTATGPQHAELALLIPLSFKQAQRAEKYSTPPGEQVRFGTAVLSRLSAEALAGL